MNKSEFNKFFKVHSQNVDNSNVLGFWKLTDEILLAYLLESMKDRDNVTVVDFGGGTGRWLLMLDKYFTNSRFVIVDLSKDMLGQAEKKVKAGLYKNKVELINTDISSIDEIESERADYIISTYNPLSFVIEPQKVIDEAYRILKSRGVAMITIQGYYNALYSKVNNYLVNSNELREIYTERKVRWNESVPKLWQLSKSDMQNLFNKAGFKDIYSRGIACITQPQGEDFDPENKQLGTLSKKINEDKKFRKTLYDIELEIGRNQDVIDRAMNILTIGVKK